MRKCSKCDKLGHNIRSCKKRLRRKNPITLDEIVTISIKQAPLQKETPYSFRPKCLFCGDLAAAILITLKNGEKQSLQWAKSCLSCLGEDLIDSNLEYDRTNPIKKVRNSSKTPSRGHRRLAAPTECKECGAPTKDKDYCLKHIEKATYASLLIKKMKETKDEVTKIAARGISAINPDSRILEEIMTQLDDRGNQTVAKLAKELSMPMKVAKIYIEFLKNNGQVKTHLTSRGSLMVGLA